MLIFLVNELNSVRLSFNVAFQYLKKLKKDTIYCCAELIGTLEETQMLTVLFSRMI